MVEITNVVEGGEVPEENKRRGDELKNWFSEEVAWSLSELWRRVHLGDYQTLEEQDFILFELLQYHSIVDRKLKANRVDTWIDRLQGCSWKTNNIQVQLPFGEVKRMSEGFRGLLLQFALELFSFATDVLFLFVLFVSDEDLFVISLSVLVLAMFGRLVSALLLFSRVNVSLLWLYVIGTVVCLFETNAGLAVIKLSLKRKESEEQTFSLVDGSDEFQRNEVSVAARNEEKAGWAEVRNIIVVTILEDLPQLGIQFVYLSRQSGELDRLFLFSFVSTIVHIVFQWTEALITLSFLWNRVCCISMCCKLRLHDLDVGREINIDYKDKACKIESGLLPWCRKTVVYSVPEITKNFSRVRFFNFTECKGIETSLSSLTSSVTKINFEFSDVNDDSLIVVSQHCPLLSHVYLIRCYEVTENGVMELVKRCRFLVHINLRSLDMTDACVDVIVEHCKMLVGIDLSETEITDTGVNQLANHCPMLTYVRLGECKGISEAGVLNLVERCQFMVDLKLYDLPITDECVGVIAERCRVMKIINLNRTKITDVGIRALTNHLDLEKIYLYKTKCTDVGLKCLASCHKLTIMSVGDNAISDYGVVQLAKGCPLLREIYLNFVISENGSRLSDVSLSAIAKHCKGLKKISISNSAISDDGVVEFAKDCSLLHTAYLNGVISENGSRLSDVSLSAITKHCKGLYYIDIRKSHVSKQSKQKLRDRGVIVND